MKQKLFYLFGLLSVTALLIYSCRNDYLQEQQTQNETNNLQLRSQIISLSESKHKAKLLSELSQAKNILKKQNSKNALGKVVNYGDSAYINTDRVIYIENGNYHNYIFKIEKSNKVDGDPFENLLLTPLPDGSYKEFLVLYSISNQELQSYESGNWEIPQNRIKVIELLPGTYNNGQLVQTNDVNCVWTTELVGYLPCSQNQHFHGEGPKICDAPKIKQPDGSPGFLSQAVYGSYWKCENIPPPPNTSVASGTGEGIIFDCPDCPAPLPCVTIPSNPMDPSTGINDDGSCETIIPIISNLGDPHESTPCNKLKNLLAQDKANVKPLITGGMYSYVNNSSKGEGGIYTKKNALGDIVNEIAPYSDTLSVPPKYGGDYYSMIHSHPKSAYPMFTYSDLTVLYMLEIKAAAHNSGQSSLLLVCEDDNGVKQTYAVVFESSGLFMEDVWATPELVGCTIEQKIEALDKKLEKMYIEEDKKTELDPSYKPNFERVFLQFCFGTNIGLYKANSDLTGWSKLNIATNSDTATVTLTNCN